MAISTDAEFEQALADDLSWRRTEMSAILGQLRTSAGSSTVSPSTRALARASLALIYAHWEGFSKQVFETYFKLVLRRRPLAIEANDALLFEHLQYAMKGLGSGDESRRLELVRMLRGFGEGRLRIAQSEIVDTHSNLRFKTLHAILTKLGLGSDDFVTKQNLIDTLLCDRRNEIAHGRALFPTPGDVEELHSEVLLMMQTIRDLLSNAVATKAYRSSSG